VVDALKVSPPEDLPEPLRAVFGSIQSRVEGSDYLGSVDLTAEQVSQLIAEGVAAQADEGEASAESVEPEPASGEPATSVPAP
jgi:hypothetical protein